MKRTYVLPVLLVLAVATAGCISDTEEPETNETEIVVTENDGLTLQFSSLSGTYQEGEPVMLELDMENTGQRTANNIQQELYGASFVARTPPQFPGQPSLQGVDASGTQRGEQTTASWEISNPVDLDEGVIQSAKAGVRVNYIYRTRATAELTVVSEQEFEGSSSLVTTERTAGPLDVVMDVESPISVPETDSGQTEVQFPIEITNVGDGSVASIQNNDMPVNVLQAEFPNADEASLDCRQQVRLFDGRGTLQCTAELPTDVFERQLTVQLELEYPYFEREELTFNIEGVRGDNS